MKVSIPVKKTVTETVELPQLPYYSTQYGAIFYMITEEQYLIQVSNRQIVYWEPKDVYYGEHLIEACQAKVCTKKEFDAAITDAMKRINAVLNPAQGAVINSMNNINSIGPGTQQAEEVKEQAAGEPTNDQVQAIEQEAQEEALESSEEGSTEG